MKNNKRFPFLLIAVGLLGISLYQILLRFNVPAIMRNDAFMGFIYGVCISIEIWGVVLAKRFNNRRAC